MSFELNQPEMLENTYFNTSRNAFFFPDQNSINTISDPEKSVALGWLIDENGKMVGETQTVVGTEDLRELSPEEKETLTAAIAANSEDSAQGMAA